MQKKGKMTPLNMTVQRYSACCERLLEEGTVLTPGEQSLLLFFAKEITEAVHSGKLNDKD